MEAYSDKIIDAFLNPRGVGNIENSQCEYSISNDEDGIYVLFGMNINNGFVYFKYKVSGCTAIIATCSAIYELYNGKPVIEAKNANIYVISNYLDGIPESKTRCAQYAVKAFLNTLHKCEDV